MSTTVKINELELHDNVRSSMTKTGLDDLAQSIAENGLLSPLTVSPNGGTKLIVVAGHRRTMAIQQGIKDGIISPDFEIPVIVREDATEGDNRLVLQLVENLQREDLGVMDEARGFSALKDMGVAQKDIARRVGRSEAHVSKRLSLLRLPDDVQEIIETGLVPLEAAIELPKLSGDGARDLARRGSNLTVREVKSRIDAEKRGKAKQKILDTLAEMGVRVWTHYVPPQDIPEGKRVNYGQGVTRIEDLPKRLAGVVVYDSVSSLELQPVTFKAASKQELAEINEAQAEHDRQRAKQERERKAFLSRVDNFVENPPAAAELVSMLARVVPLNGLWTPTWLTAKDEELAEEGRTLDEWRLSGEFSSVEARRLIAQAVLFRIEAMSGGWSMRESAELEALITFAGEVGVEFPDHVSDNVLTLLAKAWERDELAAEQAVAEAEAETEPTEDDSEG